MNRHFLAARVPYDQKKPLMILIRTYHQLIVCDLINSGYFPNPIQLELVSTKQVPKLFEFSALLI